MTTSAKLSSPGLRLPARRFAAAFAAALALTSWLAVVAPPAQAAITSAFTQVYSVNTSGNIQIRGNTLMTCQAAATKCAAAQTNTNTTAADNNNNNFFMNYVDVDADSTTFDSSSSTLAIPTGASVLFAALTWGGDTTAGAAVANTAAYGSGTPAAAPTPANAGQVKFRTAGATTYQSVSSTRTTFLSGTSGPYQGYADVTSLVQAAGNGSYTVANVQAATGSNKYAGWGLTVAYSNPSDPPRNLTVFAGYGSVTGGNTVDIPVSGFQTPLTGPVRTTLGAISYEGDAGSVGDQMQLGNTTSDLQNVSDALHPVANTFTSVISDNGVAGSTRSPSYPNQLGYDQATFNENGVLLNNATSAHIELTSNTGGETYYPGLVTFATDLYSPSITATKSVQVAHKASGNIQSGVPEPGDTLRYTITSSNNGADDAVNTIFTDAIPIGTSYVAGSLTAGATAQTDATGDDVGSYNAGTNAVRVNLGAGAGHGAGSTDGGTVALGASAPTVTFDVTVNSDIADGASIDNTARITYTGRLNGLAVAGASNTAIAAAVRHHSDLSITKTADLNLVQRGAATAVTYTLTAVNAGPYDDPGVTVTDALPTGATLVSATPSAGSCSTSAGQVSCPIGALANGHSASVQVVLRLDGVTDPASDTAAVAGQNADDHTADNTAALSTAVNTAPVAMDASATTSAGAATINVLANDSDADGDPLTATPGSTAPAKGRVVVNADQTITYTANTGSVGADAFSYNLSDGRGGTATAMVHVTIPNAPPQAQPDSASTLPHTAVTVPVLDNDTDPNIPASSQALAVSAVSQPSGGQGVVTTNGTTVAFTPSATFVRGTATFTYTVSDGAGGTDVGTVTVTVANAAPVAADDTASTAYLTPVTVDVLANDTDDNGDPLTVTAVTGANHGTATITGSGASTKIRYTPAAGWSGVDTMTYTITDGTTSVTAHVTVTTANAAPTAGDFTTTVSGGTSTTIDVAGHAGDPNGDPLTVVGTSGSRHGTVALDANGNVLYTPDPSYAGPDSFTYTVTDGNGDTVTGHVTVTVANQAPVAQDDTALVPLNASVAIGVLGNDADPNLDALTVTGTSTPAHGSAVVNGNGTITYTPTRGYLGDDSFTYDIGDGHGGTDTAAVTVTVANQPPVAVDHSAVAAGAAGSSITVDALAGDSDPNDDPITISAVSTPAHGTAVVNADGDIVYTPSATYAGPDVFTYTVSDGRGGLSTATITVDVQDRDPVADPDSATAATGMPATVDVLANDTDPDGETLSLQSFDAVSAHGGAVRLTSDGLQYTSATGFTGTDTLSYVVTDPRGGAATGLVTMTVGNAEPVVGDIAVSTPGATAVTVDLLGHASDPDGQPLTVVTTSTPAHGTVSVDSAGVATYTPPAGYHGTDTFTYTISDGEGGTDTGTVSISVANEPPRAANDAAVTPYATAVTADVLANDSDPNSDPLTVTAVSGAAHGTATIVGGHAQVRYVPNAGWHGADTVTYTISDGLGGTDTAQLTVTVGAGPVAVADHGTTEQGLATTLDPLANDQAGAGTTFDPTTVVLVDPADPSHLATHLVVTGVGAYDVFADGTVSFAPVHAFTGVSSVGYRVTDRQDNTAASTISITVATVTPVATDDTVSAAPGTTLSVDVLANDVAGDPAAPLDPASVQLVDPASGRSATVVVIAGQGTFTVTSGGRVGFVPVPGFAGRSTIAYRVADANGTVATATVRIEEFDDPQAVARPDSMRSDGGPVTLSPLDDDLASVGAHWVTASLCLVDVRDGGCVKSLAVAGVGTWRVAGAHVRFVPARGYRGTASVAYQAADSAGRTVRSTLSVHVSRASFTPSPIPSPSPSPTPGHSGRGTAGLATSNAGGLSSTGVAVADLGGIRMPVDRLDRAGREGPGGEDRADPDVDRLP